MNIKRFTKQLLCIVLTVALVFTCAPLTMAKDTKAATPGELLLATVSDTHYYPQSLAKYKGEAFYTYLEGANCIYDDLDAMMDSLLASLKKSAEEKGLKYVVISGDLTTNGEYEGHIALAAKLKKFEQDTGLQVFVTPGNHDINNSDASQFINANGSKEPARKTTPQEFYEIYKEFGFSDAKAQYSDFTTGKAGALSYVQVVDGGYRLIFADGGKYTSDVTESGKNEHETGGTFSEDLLNWILSQAATAKKNGETPILITHWNMSGMNYMHEYILQGFVIDDGYMVREKLADAGIHYAFSGHQHVSDIDITYTDSGEPMYSVITPTATQFPYAYRETKFTRDNTGTITAKFDQIDIDSAQAVKSGTDSTYPTPYRVTTGFAKQNGNLSASNYFMRMIKNMLSGYIEEIKAEGSVIKFIEKKANINVSDYINKLITDAIGLSGLDIITSSFTSNNIMNFLNDLDMQIMNNYIYDTDKLYSSIQTALDGLVNVKVSDVPCTKFLSTYGFGNASSGGTIQDLFFSALVYMYVGNEDISDDAFMQDVLKNCKTTEFVDLIFSSAIKYVVDGVVVDELLSTLQVRLTKLLGSSNASIAEYLQVLYIIIMALVGSKVFMPNSFQDFANKLYKFTYLLTDTSVSQSYKSLIDIVLGTGYISYGGTIDELVNNLLNTYIGKAEREAAAYQIGVICSDLLIDEDRDWDVTYVYSGPVEVTPTTEKMQLPANVNVSFGANEQSDVTIKWITKYSVEGTDIEIVKKGASFIGKPTTGKNIKASVKQGEYSSEGFSFGTFGIMPWSHVINEHTLTLTGLTANTAYQYRIGDASKGFWSETGSFVTAGGDSFTFLAAGNAAGVAPSDYAEWQNTVNAAVKTVPDARFMLYTGDAVYKGDDDDQWTLALNSVNKQLLNLPLMYTPGDKDVGENECMKKYFGAPLTSQYIAGKTGPYYSFDYNGAHICVLNANELADDGTLTANQLKWLRDDLADSTGMWNIISVHNGFYGTSADNTALANQLQKIITDYDVDLIIQGSELVYTRTHVVIDGVARTDTDVAIKKIGSKDVLTYMNTKGQVAVSTSKAGAACGEKLPASEFNETEDGSSNVFISVTVEGENLAVYAYSVNASGKVKQIDSFGISKSKLSALLGDIDRDGKITSADARLALRYSVDLEPNLRVLAKLCADVNMDKKIDSSDARSILRVSVGLDTFTPPYVYYYPSELDSITF